MVRADGGTFSEALTCCPRPSRDRCAGPVTTAMPAAEIPCGRDTAPRLGPASGALTDPPDFALAAADGTAPWAALPAEADDPVLEPRLMRLRP